MERIFNKLALTLLVALSMTGCADSQTLSLAPAGSPQLKPVGSLLVMICKTTDVSTKGQNLNWFAPRNFFPFESNPKVVKSRDKMPRNPGTNELSRIYVDLNPDGSLSLTISNIQPTDSGSYTCSGRVAGMDAYQDFVLQTYEGLEVQAASRQFLILNEDFSTIRCAVKGAPSPQATWTKNGLSVTSVTQGNDGTRYELSSDGLMVYSPNHEDKGLYTCRGMMSVGSVLDVKEVQIDVDVYTPPVITDPPMLQDPSGFGVVNHDVVFNCSASGYPSPEYTWFSGSVAGPAKVVNNENFGTRFRPNSAKGTLHIIELRLEDSGYYWCSAGNAAGTSQANVLLNVMMIPYFSWNANSTDKNDGATTVLICQSKAMPLANMTFRRLGRDLPYTEGVQKDDQRIRVSQQLSAATEEEQLVRPKEVWLTITDLRPSDMANYTCVAENVAGRNETTQEIRVNFKPQFLNENAVVYNWEGNRRNLTCGTYAWPLPQFIWTFLGSPISNSESYKIYYEWMSSSLEVWVPMVPTGTSLFGDYACTASNNRGSSVRVVKLDTAQLPDSPTNVTVVNRTPTSITLAAELPRYTGGIPLVLIEVLPQIASDVLVARRFLLDEIQSMEVKDLHWGTEYVMRVSAKNEKGSGRDWSLKVSTLQASKPYPVPIISGKEELLPNSYTLIWDTPDNGGMAISEYRIEWRQADPSSRPGAWISRTVRSSVTSYVIVGLVPNTYYEVRVLATNPRGTSDPPETSFIFVTAQGDGSGGIVPGPDQPLPIYLGSLQEYHLIIIAVVGFVVILLVIDLIFLCTKKCGLFMCLYKSCSRHHGDHQSKMDPDAAVPLTPLYDDQKKYDGNGEPMNDVKQPRYAALGPVSKTRYEGQGRPVMTARSQVDSQTGITTPRGGAATPQGGPAKLQGEAALLRGGMTTPMSDWNYRDPPPRVFAPSRSVGDVDDWEPGETNVDDAFLSPLQLSSSKGSLALAGTTTKPTMV